MLQVELLGLKFKAFHGVHEFEKKQGNDFVVDLIVDVSNQLSLESDDINDAVDYEKLHQIVKKEMQISSELLENVAFRITASIIEAMSDIEKVKIRIAKINPPIEGECAESAVTYVKNRG